MQFALLIWQNKSTRFKELLLSFCQNETNCDWHSFNTQVSYLSLTELSISYALSVANRQADWNVQIN